MTVRQRPDRTYGHPHALRPLGITHAVYEITVDSSADQGWAPICITPIAASQFAATPLEPAGPPPGGARIPPCLRVVGHYFDEEK